ncbi:MAG TPA: hypothetical protein VIX37_23765, partial [Candidatus Sulfotelmatobacter sp.]
LYDGRPEIILNRISQITGRRLDPSAPQELRRREPRPLQCRGPAPCKETRQGQSHTFPYRDLRQRC